MENTNYMGDIIPKNFIMVGFGIIGQAVLPLIFRHCQVKPEQITILTKDNDGREIAEEFGVELQIVAITKENYISILSDKISEGDFLLNLSVGVSSCDLIELCQKRGALYLDTCTEPWDGVYTDKSLTPSSRTNYAFRESVLKLKDKSKSTAVLTHGANPGLISHFVKQALLNLAMDNDLNFTTPESSADWASLANILGIKSIHIAERDTQITHRVKSAGEFVNTWSVDGFLSEGAQPAELGWGTHERHWPHDGCRHAEGSQCAIYLERPGAGTKVRSWTPILGPFHGFLITHAESISIANYLTLKETTTVHYRPTVHYAYIPCPDAILSLHEFAGNCWHEQEKHRLILHEIVEGGDELGVLLMGNKKGAYWYGSHLTIQEARELAPHNNATSLQVAAGVLAGVIWALKNPARGLVEPEDMDYQFIMKVALPYLGRVQGHYTDWNPLKDREKLFNEHLDTEDPWQFINIRVD